MASLFGWEIRRQSDLAPAESFVAPQKDDGASQVSEGGVFAQALDLDGSARTAAELISRYREMEQHPEVDTAITDICNESIVYDPKTPIVKMNLDGVQLPDNIKTALQAEFEGALNLLEFNAQAYDIFKRWYVDGRLFYHAIIDKDNPKEGIKELRYIDPRKIRKIRQVKREQNSSTSESSIKVTKEYYIFNDRGFAQGSNLGSGSQSVTGLMIAKDAIINTTSGITDPTNSIVMSYLHKAIKPLNQLRCMEDSLVIMRLNRSVSRRVFYIDVGNLPKMKAEQYVRDMMAKFKNRLVYDASTGEVKDERKYMTMLEDFWLPRRGANGGTQIDILQGGENLGEVTDITYFQQKLFRSLNVPIGRLVSENGFNFGKSSEITRDEVNFSKFITRLRAKFALLFLKIMERQVVLKGMMSIDDWDKLAPLITFDYQKDNQYEELKELEILGLKTQALSQVEPFLGRFFSLDWVRKHILGQSDEDIKQMMIQIQAEMKNGLYAPVVPEPGAKPGVAASGAKNDTITAPTAGGGARYLA